MKPKLVDIKTFSLSHTAAIRAGVREVWRKGGDLLLIYFVSFLLLSQKLPEIKFFIVSGMFWNEELLTLFLSSSELEV